MRSDLGGLRRDQKRPELLTLEREAKRGLSSGGREGVQPLCGTVIAHAVQTVSQSIPWATWTTVTQDSEVVDNDNVIDLATDRVVVKYPGYYDFEALFHLGTSTLDLEFVLARFLVNGVAQGEQGPITPGPNRARVHTAFGAKLARGGTVALQGWHDNTASAARSTYVTDNASYLRVTYRGLGEL